jgi:hypothetical protein
MGDSGSTTVVERRQPSRRRRRSAPDHHHEEDEGGHGAQHPPAAIIRRARPGPRPRAAPPTASPPDASRPDGSSSPGGPRRSARASASVTRPARGPRRTPPLIWIECALVRAADAARTGRRRTAWRMPVGARPKWRHSAASSLERRCPHSVGPGSPPHGSPGATVVEGQPGQLTRAPVGKINHSRDGVVREAGGGKLAK